MEKKELSLDEKVFEKGKEKVGYYTRLNVKHMAENSRVIVESNIFIGMVDAVDTKREINAAERSDENHWLTAVRQITSPTPKLE